MKVLGTDGQAGACASRPAGSWCSQTQPSVTQAVGFRLSLCCVTPSKAQSNDSTASFCCLLPCLPEEELAPADTGSPGSTGWEHLLVALCCVKEILSLSQMEILKWLRLNIPEILSLFNKDIHTPLDPVWVFSTTSEHGAYPRVC